MEGVVSLIESIGFPLVAVIAMSFFIYTIINRDKDEAAERERRLVEINRQNSQTLSDIAVMIKESNSVNIELSETNRLLVDKIEGQLDGIGKDIEELLSNTKSI